MREVVIRARVPKNAGTVYLTGSLPELGPWDPGKLAMEGTGEIRTSILRVTEGTKFEFKFTLGSWEREGLGPSGTVMPNFDLLVDGDRSVLCEIVDFKKATASYLDSWRESGVCGRLDYWRDVKSKFLEPTRHVEVWLPPEYDENRTKRYRVLYMHDGQNLFDPRIANTGVDWGVDESVMRLVEAGAMEPIIVVGVWCTDDRRFEYSPWHKGPCYARFLIEELIPRVNANYRTQTGPQNTGTMGSSMGGLISFHLCQEHPHVFGRGGCISTHWPWTGEPQYPTAERPALIESSLVSKFTFPPNARIYFDYGTKDIDATYEPYQSRVTEHMKALGYSEGRNMMVKKCEGAGHREVFWRDRLDVPMRFLWGKDQLQTPARRTISQSP